MDSPSVKCSFEMLYRDLLGLGHSLTSEDKDRLMCQLKKEEWKALHDLQNDDTIIITRPDKGNSVVIVNRIDYLNKMKQLISDETKFKKLSRHYFTRIMSVSNVERCINTLIWHISMQSF